MAKFEVVDSETGEVVEVSRPLKTSERLRVVKVFKNPSRAKQSFKDECDINTIMKRFQVTGVVEHVRQAQARYFDATAIPDFKTSMEAVVDAISRGEELFASLPAKVRRQFGNDATTFLDFAADAANEGELKELGILPVPGPLPSPPGGDPQSGGSSPVDPAKPSPEASKAAGGAV